MTPARSRLIVTTVLLLTSIRSAAHDGPPFPIVSDKISGSYAIDVWADPDATDDGSAGGQFWITVKRADTRRAAPANTTVRVAIRPLDRDGAELTATAAPVRGDITNQFAALVMAHEGPFSVRVTVDGPLGNTAIEARADATYDLRPPAYMLFWYAMPFVVAGALWIRLLVKRRGGGPPYSSGTPT
jgi:hypothetical protein